MIKNGVVKTPTAHACLPGITRGTVIEMCQQEGIPIEEGSFSLTEFYTADEVFATGTMGELTRVHEIDGRAIRGSGKNEVFQHLVRVFQAKTAKEGIPIPGI
jgi:branched-chain amino acid aminotransferase